MKNFIKLLPVLLAGLMIFSACEEVVPPVPVLPTIVLVEEAGFAVDGDSVVTETEFVVKVTATQGDDLLSRLSVSENGTDITELTRLTFDGDVAGSNPTPLPTEAQTGFTWTVGIVSGKNDQETNAYTISVTDATGNVAQVSFDITTEVGLETATGYLLLNQAGPSGTGGLDLDEGIGTGSADLTAEIADEGIDLGAPSNATNWKQQIIGVNGTTLRIPDAGLEYDLLNNRTQLEAAYDAGVDVTTTEKVVIGDVFLVKNGEKYFVIKTVDITVTADDNDDFYEFEVKK
ncbi:MAG: hypothetical protein AB8H47_05665 [Bacteroidia bacterium]